MSADMEKKSRFLSQFTIFTCLWHASLQMKISTSTERCWDTLSHTVVITYDIQNVVLTVCQIILK